MTTVTLVIPFFNEENNLPILFNELKNVIREKPDSIDLETFFVNDASTDDSKAIIEKEIKNKKNFKLINLNTQSGQTGAFKKAFQECDSEYIIRMDSDLQDDPRDLLLFFNKILEIKPDLIMGVRVERQHNFLLRISSTIYDLLIKTLYHTTLKTNSGSFVAFKTDYVKNLPWKKNDHRYLPLIAIQRGATNIIDVDVFHRERKHGKTNYPYFKKIIFGPIEVIKLILRLKNGFYDF